MSGNFTRTEAGIREFTVVFTVFLLVVSLAGIPLVVDAQSVASVSFDDQRTDGHDVYLEEIVLTHGGWVDVRTTDGDVLWTNRGNPDLPYFEPGESYSGWITLAPALTHNQTITAVLYNDTDQNRVFDPAVDAVASTRDAKMTVQIRSDFDEGSEGWRFVSSTSETTSDRIREAREPQSRSMGGSTGGYIVASDEYDGSNWDDGTAIREWIAPEQYLGDRSNFYDGTLSFDARGSVDWETCAPGSRYEDRPTLPYDVSFYSGDRELRYRFLETEYVEGADYTRIDWYSSAPGVEWQRYTIPIRAPSNATEVSQGIGDGRWDYYEIRDGKRGSYADGLTEATFREIFSNVERIEIQGESVNELRDTACEGQTRGEEGHLGAVIWNSPPPAEGAIDAGGEDSDEANDDTEPLTGEADEQASPADDSATQTSTEAPGFSVMLSVGAIIGIALLSRFRIR